MPVNQNCQNCLTWYKVGGDCSNCFVFKYCQNCIDWYKVGVGCSNCPHKKGK